MGRGGGVECPAFGGGGLGGCHRGEVGGGCGGVWVVVVTAVVEDDDGWLFVYTPTQTLVCDVVEPPSRCAHFDLLQTREKAKIHPPRVSFRAALTTQAQQPTTPLALDLNLSLYLNLHLHHSTSPG